ncbi:MAG TPA: HlyD family type I secretion periplasmic adaptor subunit [Xanthobacteraceae bacterium]
MQSAKRTSQGAVAKVQNMPPFSRANKGLDKHELAFLPAALEIVETPPSPVGRAIAFNIIALFCLALAWAVFGRVDIVASATGKIIPTGYTKVIQAFETGVVRAIHVHDGQAVRKGEVLIELDPTINQAETSHLESDLIAAKLDVARLRAALSDGDVLASFKPPEGAPASLVAVQRKFLADQAAEQQAKLAVLDHQRAQREAERATIAATVNKLEASLPVLQQRLDIRKTLYDHTTGSKANYLELLQPFVEEQHELLVQKSKINEADSALAAIIEERAHTDAEYGRERLSELVEAERKARGLSDDVVKAQHRTQLQELVAPVDGIVQQLSVHSIGGVVTPAQTLLVVVPADSHLEIEATVLNRDIGFVRVGQEAQIKIDTFNFGRYGLLHGKVLNVSADAIMRDKSQDKAGKDGSQDAQNATSEPKGQELVYAARVSLDHEQMQVDDQLVNLSPGMAVTVEIKTGTRRIISYLLSPLARYAQDSLRER